MIQPEDRAPRNGAHLRVSPEKEMTNFEDDPDKLIIEQRFPGLKNVGDRIRIDQGPLAGEPLIIRRRFTAREGVLFTLKYDDGRFREWEWFD